MHLQYYEKNDLIISGTSDLIGSSADLGVYPHWCLGNIHLCNNGLSVSLLLKAHRRQDNATKTIIFSTGGYFSEGIYLIQNYGDQYELGISKGNDLWSARFILLPEIWLPVTATWNETYGLRVTVDHDVIVDNTPEQREFVAGNFDPFAQVLIGVDETGMVIENENLFDIKNIVFHDETLEKVPVQNCEYLKREVIIYF